MRRVTLHGKPLALSDRVLLGSGGEARVYAHGSLAIKLYHLPDRALCGSDQCVAREQQALRLAKLAAFPKDLPEAVIAPQALVYDDAGTTVVGYAMRKLEHARDFAQLGQRSFREGVISNQQLIDLFRQLYLVLDELHQKGVIVGDLNDGNVVFVGPESGKDQRTSAGGKAYLIDADSMQFGRFPCFVGHERFLDPHLYGADLRAHLCFDERSDWYAFATLLFCCLLYVHPYGGVHPGYPTLLRRAEARTSVLQSQVKLPKVAAPIDVLPPAMRDYFSAVFDRNARSTFPATLLESRWVRCSCGVEHARTSCPCCKAKAATKTPSLPRQSKGTSLLVVGRCRALPIFSTPGRLLAACVDGGRLHYVYQAPGRSCDVIRRENGVAVAEQGAMAGMRFAISKDATWIGWREQLICIKNGAKTVETRTANAFAEPVFDATSRACFRLQDDWIIDHDRTTRVGQVLANQCWLRLGADLGHGFYRAGALLIGFVFSIERPQLRTLPLPPLRGRLLQAHSATDRHHVLLSLLTELHGKRLQMLYLFDDSPRLVASHCGDPAADRLLGNPRGYALFAGRLLTCTDEGLLSADVDRPNGKLVERHLFGDTRPFCDAHAELHVASGGSVYVVTTKQITQLALV